jgi:hypothetical protein
VIEYAVKEKKLPKNIVEHFRKACEFDYVFET